MPSSSGQMWVETDVVGVLVAKEEKSDLCYDGSHNIRFAHLLLIRMILQWLRTRRTTALKLYWQLLWLIDETSLNRHVLQNSHESPLDHMSTYNLPTVVVSSGVSVSTNLYSVVAEMAE